MELVDNFEYHKGNNSVSLEEYYRQRRLKLGCEVASKKVVYLDTKFWLLLRDASLYPDKKVNVTDFLKLCVELVKSGRFIFPISEDIYWEITKQVDPRTLKATARLIDKLSQGISVVGYDERVKSEVLHFMYHSMGKVVFEMNQIAWTKLPYHMGFSTFEIPILSYSDNLMMQKAFLDQMWCTSMLDMIEFMQKGGSLERAPDIKVADKLNAGKTLHQDEAKSFRQMYLNEVGGVVGLFREDLAAIAFYIYEKESGKRMSTAEKESHKTESMRLWGNVIYNLFKMKKIGKLLPSINIAASLHAAVRWDQKRSFVDNDFHDFRHAVAALPYCDYFFTERSLAHLITQKNLSFDRLYGCKVESNIKAAHKALLGGCDEDSY